MLLSGVSSWFQVQSFYYRASQSELCAPNSECHVLVSSARLSEMKSSNVVANMCGSSQNFDSLETVSIDFFWFCSLLFSCTRVEVTIVVSQLLHLNKNQ
jgi:hypothetical protein